MQPLCIGVTPKVSTSPSKGLPSPESNFAGMEIAADSQGPPESFPGHGEA